MPLNFVIYVMQEVHPPIEKEETMSIYAAIVTLVLLLVFVPISLLPLYFDIPRQDDDALAQMRE